MKPNLQRQNENAIAVNAFDLIVEENIQSYNALSILKKIQVED
jgi:hypothetical protein